MAAQGVSEFELISGKTRRTQKEQLQNGAATFFSVHNEAGCWWHDEANGGKGSSEREKINR